MSIFTSFNNQNTIYQIDKKFRDFDPEISRFHFVKFSIKSVSLESISHPSVNLLDSSLYSYYDSLSTSKQEIIFELEQPTLVGFIRVFNRHSSEIEISVAMNYQDSEYITTQKNIPFPKNKASLFRCGYLPTKYIKLSLKKGHNISLYYIQILGINLGIFMKDVHSSFGPSVDYLTCRIPLQYLYNPVTPKPYQQLSLNKQLTQEPSNNRHIRWCINREYL